MSARKGCSMLPGMYQRRTAVWEGRGATARPWEARWSSGVAAVFWGILQQQKMFSKILDLSIVYLSCVYIYFRLVMPSYLLFCCVYFNAEVLVLGLLVVCKIPYISCRFNTAVVLEPGKM